MSMRVRQQFEHEFCPLASGELAIALASRSAAGSVGKVIVSRRFRGCLPDESNWSASWKSHFNRKFRL